MVLVFHHFGCSHHGIDMDFIKIIHYNSIQSVGGAEGCEKEQKSTKKQYCPWIVALILIDIGIHPVRNDYKIRGKHESNLPLSYVSKASWGVLKESFLTTSNYQSLWKIMCFRNFLQFLRNWTSPAFWSNTCTLCTLWIQGTWTDTWKVGILQCTWMISSKLTYWAPIGNQSF